MGGWIEFNNDRQPFSVQAGQKTTLLKGRLDIPCLPVTNGNPFPPHPDRPDAQGGTKFLDMGRGGAAAAANEMDTQFDHLPGPGRHVTGLGRIDSPPAHHFRHTGIGKSRKRRALTGKG